jgi:hypothetical protein
VFIAQHVANRFEQACRVEPADPAQARKFDALERAPRAQPRNDLRLEEPNRRLGERDVVGAAAADRWRDAGVAEPVGLAHRHVLRALIAMMHEARLPLPAALADRLLQRIQHEVGA